MREDLPPPGYVELDVRVDLDAGRTLRRMPTGNLGMPGNLGALAAIEAPNLGLRERTRAAVLAIREAKPWTLVEMPNGATWVAARRTFWWRLVTWWHNLGRRRALRRLEALRAKYAANIVQRARKSQ